MGVCLAHSRAALEAMARPITAWPPTIAPSWPPLSNAHALPPPLPPQLVEAAEAKAYYGLAVNYRALTALAKELMEKESMTGAEVRELLEREGEGHSLGNSFGVAQLGGGTAWELFSGGGGPGAAIAGRCGNWGAPTAWELFCSTSCDRASTADVADPRAVIQVPCLLACLHAVPWSPLLPHCPAVL